MLPFAVTEEDTEVSSAGVVRLKSQILNRSSWVRPGLPEPGRAFPFAFQERGPKLCRAAGRAPISPLAGHRGDGHPRAVRNPPRATAAHRGPAPGVASLAALSAGGRALAKAHLKVFKCITQDETLFT